MVETKSGYRYSMSIPTKGDLVEIDLADGTRLWFPSTWTALVRDQQIDDGFDVDVSLTFEARPGTDLPRCTRISFELPQTDEVSTQLSLLRHQHADLEAAMQHAQQAHADAERVLQYERERLVALQRSLQMQIDMAAESGAQEVVGMSEAELRLVDARVEHVSMRAESAARDLHQLAAHQADIAEAIEHVRGLKGLSERTPSIGDGARLPTSAQIKDIIGEARLGAAQRSPDELFLSTGDVEGLRRSLRSQRKMRITSELLTEVAQLYREAVDQGEHPRQYIAERVAGGPVSKSTVATWVGLARERTDPATGKPFLGPAKGTRAGEAPDR